MVKDDDEEVGEVVEELGGPCLVHLKVADSTTAPIAPTCRTIQDPNGTRKSRGG